MRNLMEWSNDQVKEESSKSTIEPVNEALIRVLFKEGLKLTRTQLKARLSMDRLIDAHSEKTLQEMNEDKLTELFIKTSKTVKNGLDTSISRSNNNSSFHYNPKYEAYKLERLNDGTYQITKRKAK